MKANGTIVVLYVPLIIIACLLIFLFIIGVKNLFSKIDWYGSSNDSSNTVSSDSNQVTDTENISTEKIDEVVSVSLYDTVVNDDPDDEISNFSRLKINDYRCYHFKVSLSGADSVQLSYIIYYSDEETDSDTFPMKHNGDSGCCWFELTDKIDYEYSGTEKVEIYRDDTGEVIYTFSVEVYNDVSEADDDYMNDGQIFPNSSDEYLSSSDVESLSSNDIQEAINEIYARHGYKFNNDELTDYFSKYDWYHPTISSEDFSTNVFSDIERKNIELLSEYR